MHQLNMFETTRTAWDGLDTCRSIARTAEYCVGWYGMARVASRWQDIYRHLQADAERLQRVCDTCLRRLGSEARRTAALFEVPLSGVDAAAVDALEERYHQITMEASGQRFELIPDNTAWKSKRAPLWRDANCPELARQTRSRQRELVGV